MNPSPIETMLRHLKGFVKEAQRLIAELEEIKVGKPFLKEGFIFKEDTDLKDLPEGKLVDKKTIT